MDQMSTPQGQTAKEYFRDMIRKNGSVRLIVTLRVPAQSEQLPGAAQTQAQRQNLSAAQDAFLKRIARLGGKPGKQFETLPYVVLHANDATLEHILNQSPDAVSVQEDRLNRPTLAESVPLIGGANAWATGATGAGQTVAILDTGVDSTHPFLSGKVVAEACFSSNDTSQGFTIKSACPNGGTSQTGTGSAKPCSANECIHGTHVAGIAAGTGTSFSGVAKGAKVMAIQVFSLMTSYHAKYCKAPPCAFAFDSDYIRGLEYVYNQRQNFAISSANMSLGGGSYGSNCDDNAAKQSIDNLRAAGIATVIASGNDGYTGTIASPACISSAISVGATTKSDAVASFSNSAGILSLLAPGAEINASVPGGGYQKLSGTSMAAPHVAGAWAVLKSKKPGATVEEIANALKSTGKLITDSRNRIAKPRIRVDAALNSLGMGTSTTTTTSTSSTLNSSTTTSSTTTTTLAAACYTSSNYAHVAAGRAYNYFGYAYAYGSNQYLGVTSTYYTSTLKKTGANYYVIGTCP